MDVRRRPISPDWTSHTSDLARSEVRDVRFQKKNEKMRVPRIHHLQELWSDPCGGSGAKAPPLAMRPVAGRFSQQNH